MIKIKVRTRDKLEALTSNKDFENVFGERRAGVMGNLSRKMVENHKLESQTTKLSLALNPGRSFFCKGSLRAICSDKKLKFDASALKAFYIRNLNLVNSLSANQKPVWRVKKLTVLLHAICDIPLQKLDPSFC